MNIIPWTLAGALTGLVLGVLAAFFAGRPVREGKSQPLLLRLGLSLPALALLLVLFLLGDLMPGKRIFFIALLVFFACGNAGAALGLSGRDPALLELAFVYRMPDPARMTAIDLPASFGMILRFFEGGAILSALLIFADEARRGAAGLPSLLALVLILILAGEASAFFYRRGLKKEGRL